MDVVCSLRIEKANGVYYVINRGNYRQDLFINEGAHLSFERCLFEACEKCGWVLEGWCVMTNHFHLVIRTPEGNLVYGMKWLQSTFANRYHRFRKVHGKLFQGRYKSLIIEDESYLGALLHYVHLNPVRAGMVDVSELGGYRWSSYWYLRHPSKRPEFIDPDPTPANSGDRTVSLSVGNTSLATDQAISEAPSMISHIGFTRFEGRGGEVPMLS